MTQWNQRVQMPPANSERVAHVAGCASKDLIRGEVIGVELDRTDVLTSDKIAFSPWSTPLMLRPADC